MYLHLRWLAPALLCAALSCNIYAVDGVVLIDQNRALAGGVTPGDTPGFPVTISQPGSYHLSGNLTVPNVNGTAITIMADDVTIDLNGFSIIGPTVCGGYPVISCSPVASAPIFGIGIEAGASGNNVARHNITIANGTIRGMGGDGINIGGFGAHVEKLHVFSNGGTGIKIYSGVVTGNSVTINGFRGIQIVGSASVTGNNVVGNADSGFFISCPTAMVGNTAFNNGVANVAFAGSGSSVGCAFTGNAP